jgi:hypothetical protein
MMIDELDSLTYHRPDPRIHHQKRELTQSAFLKGDENQTATVEASLALIAEPVIGLEFIQEFDSKSYDGSLDYSCYLCSNAALNIYTISSHVISSKHRKRYLQLKHPEIWKQVVAAGRKNFTVACQKFAQEVEEEFGRQKILRLEEEFSQKFPDDWEKAEEPRKPPRGKPTEIECNICLITCNGETEFDSHIKGAKHKKVLASVNPGGAFGTKTDAIEANFNALKEPIIGLEYIEEFQFTDASHNELRFNCHICKISTLTKDTISAHVVSVRHRRRYTKLKYPNFHTEIVAAGCRKSSQQVSSRIKQMRG